MDTVEKLIALLYAASEHATPKSALEDILKGLTDAMSCETGAVYRLDLIKRAYLPIALRGSTFKNIDLTAVENKQGSPDIMPVIRALRSRTEQIAKVSGNRQRIILP